MKTSQAQLDLIGTVFKKGTKSYLLAAEIAQRWNGETEANEINNDDRLRLSEKYGVERTLITNVLSGLRTIGMYRDKHYHMTHSHSGGTVNVIPNGTEMAQPPLATKPNETPPPVTTPSPSETSLKTSLDGTGMVLPATPPSSTGTQVPPAENRVPRTEMRMVPEASLDELKGLVSKQQTMINDLPGQPARDCSFY